MSNLENEIGELLIRKELTLGVVESATGGLISHSITNTPGSSAYYKGSITAYSNEMKMKLVGVKEDTLEKCIIEKYNETICVINAGDSLFTVITQREAKPGIIFVYARKIIEEIQEILG